MTEHDDNEERAEVVRCENHAFELSVGVCGSCNYDFCAECLVYPRGEKRPAMCMRCALAAGGVRSGAARAPRPRTETQRRRKPSRTNPLMTGSVGVWVVSGMAAVGGAAVLLLG